MPFKVFDPWVVDFNLQQQSLDFLVRGEGFFGVVQITEGLKEAAGEFFK